MPYIDDDFLSKLEYEPIYSEPSARQQEAFARIERLSRTRERSTSELRQRLVREGFEEADVQAAIERACACGLVDDARFASILVRSRLSQGRGIKGIEAELEELGIPAGDVPEFVELQHAMQDEDEELERALALLRRRPPRARNVQAAAFRSLVSKGYATSVAAAAARRFAEEGDF